MRTTTLALAILACGTLPAQDIGLTLGGSTVRPQSIEGLDIPRTTSVLAGASVRYGLLDVGVTFRPEAESKFGGNAFEWSYTAANIQACLPLHRSGDYLHEAVLGASYRWERTTGREPGATSHDKRGRLWGVAGYRFTVQADGIATELMLGSALAKRDSYDDAAIYTPKEVLRILAPSFEILATATVRF